MKDPKTHEKYRFNKNILHKITETRTHNSN